MAAGLLESSNPGARQLAWGRQRLSPTSHGPTVNSLPYQPQKKLFKTNAVVFCGARKGLACRLGAIVFSERPRGKDAQAFPAVSLETLRLYLHPFGRWVVPFAQPQRPTLGKNRELNQPSFKVPALEHLHLKKLTATALFIVLAVLECFHKVYFKLASQKY